MKATRINYDILVYLPDDIETIQGENILSEDFNMGAFSVVNTNLYNNKKINIDQSSKICNNIFYGQIIKICKHRKIILILALLLLIPSLIGMKATRINYDILVYLPDDIETSMKKEKTEGNDKESRLLNTAFKLFTEKGMKDTSIQDIVDNANVAKGTFYLYFKDK